ncbi:MAG: beta-ketoacyl-[acyl-carrier-protein] synthase family protein [Candidatus Omnitrophota bacterium]|jgi:3-oxoacyl-[acyl-carrier-protein] synthase II|nr:MAG: beta-ketoacyl-[acyl-carrier-protein] synthase family protein [Candidatus Omnitrophota bacterium]
MAQNRRVAVTGLGVVSSVGIGKDHFWNSISNGKSGITRIKSFDTSAFDCHYGGEVKGFSVFDFLDDKNVALLGRNSQFAIISSFLALKDSGYRLDTLKREKTGVILGTVFGEKGMEHSLEVAAQRKPDKITYSQIASSLPNCISSNVAAYFSLSGRNSVIPAACAAGNYSISHAFDLIKSGDLNCALAGASDYFSKAAFYSFNRLYAMAPRKCQPFDKNRKGMLLGEGSAILFLETVDSALKRGAHIYAEILGYGLSCDARHLTAPSQQGIEKCIVKALRYSGIGNRQVDYISAHGTGTYSNDRTECAAIKRIFPGYKSIPVSSIKSMLGHTLGAASSIEAVACCLSLEKGIIPPTINFRTTDKECDVDCVPNKARKKNIKVVLNNGFAFGGNNCCVVFKKWGK